MSLEATYSELMLGKLYWTSKFDAGKCIYINCSPVRRAAAAAAAAGGGVGAVRGRR